MVRSCAALARVLWLSVVIAGALTCSPRPIEGTPPGAPGAETLTSAHERHWMVLDVPHSHVAVALGREPSEAERTEVAALVERYRTRRDTFDLSLLEDYVAAHPDSPYAPSLHFAIALAAREMARYQDTFTHLEAGAV